MKALELIRVLDVRRGDGTFVTSLEPSLLLEAMSFVIDIHQDHTILDLFEVRRLLEPAAAAMATLKATPDDLERLTAMLGEVGPRTSVEDLVAHDVTFHGLICELSGNAYLSTLLESLSGRTLRARDRARPDRGEQRRAHPGRAPGDRRRHGPRQHRPGAVVGDGAHQRGGVVSA